MAIKLPPIVWIGGALVLVGTTYFLLQNPQSRPTVPSLPALQVPVLNAGQKPNLPFSLSIQGSTSMVSLFRDIANSAPTGSAVEWQATSSDAGIQALQTRQIAIAGSSRELTFDEQNGQPRLAAKAIAIDEVAVIVGKNNPFSGSLTKQQVREIFSGRITNWSQVGGPDKPIKVINRAKDSGTRSFFQSRVMAGDAFTTSGITMPKDETTGILRILGDDGISYATFSQVFQQTSTTKWLAVDGSRPGMGDKNYELSRKLYLLYRVDEQDADVQALLNYTQTPAFTSLVLRNGFGAVH